MKAQILNHFGSGLFLLVVLTIAVVASQAQAGLAEPLAAEDAIEVDARFRIEIDHGGLERLESLLSDVEPVPELPISIEINTGDFVAPEVADPDTATVQ
jgi:hypothetical protein